MRWILLVLLFGVVAAGYGGMLPINPKSDPISDMSAYGGTKRTTSSGSSQTSALSGDRIIINDTEMWFQDLTCPPPETEAGRDAKALMNTFLRVGDIDCLMTRTTGQPWRGACTAEGKDIAEGMRKSGLCS